MSYLRLTAPIRIDNVTEYIATGQQGTATGGAIVPGNACSCNCGLTASLDCGTITAAYYGEIFATLQYRDYWEYIDSGDSVIGSNQYTAQLIFASETEGCEATVLISADNTNFDGGFGEIVVTEAGAGTFYYRAKSNLRPDDPASLLTGALRPGLIMASAAGVYGDDPEIGYCVTVPQSVPVEWRQTV